LLILENQGDFYGAFTVFEPKNLPEQLLFLTFILIVKAKQEARWPPAA